MTDEAIQASRDSVCANLEGMRRPIGWSSVAVGSPGRISASREAGAREAPTAAASGASSSNLASVDAAALALNAGRPVIVTGAEQGRSGGILVFSADRATPKSVAFAVRYTSGFLRVSIPESDAARLNLPLMVSSEVRTGDDTVAVDARVGITTGISAADRARTIRLLASATSRADNFTRPGHVVPVRTDQGGVLRRAGYAEAALDLVRLAGCRPAAAWSHLVSECEPLGDVSAAEIRAFADRHELVLIAVDELVAYRWKAAELVTRGASARIPLRQGTFTAVGYSSNYDGHEHTALTFGDVTDGVDVLVRVQRECVHGDVFGALHCDCRRLLEMSLDQIVEEGRGVLLYVRTAGQRGRDPLRSAESSIAQASGLEHQADEADMDVREQCTVAQILVDLGIRSMQLLTHCLGPGPSTAYGIPVTCERLLQVDADIRDLDGSPR